jgi:hypothetical protein
MDLHELDRQPTGQRCWQLKACHRSSPRARAACPDRIGAGVRHRVCCRAWRSGRQLLGRGGLRRQSQQIKEIGQVTHSFYKVFINGTATECRGFSIINCDCQNDI